MILVAIGVIVAYWITNQAWEITDFIALCIVGTMLKIFKFNNMKDATFFLMCCMVSDICLAVIIHFTKEQISYDNLIISNFSSPLEF